MQIYMSQHALSRRILRLRATLSLWLLWENLQQPPDLRWLGAFGAALALPAPQRERVCDFSLLLAGAVLEHAGRESHNAPA